MARKPVRYTRHAGFRMATRGISEKMVLETLLSPDRAGTGYRSRSVAWRTFPEGRIRVVYSEKADALVVIAAMWS